MHLHTFLSHESAFCTETVAGDRTGVVQKPLLDSVKTIMMVPSTLKLLILGKAHRLTFNPIEACKPICPSDGSMKTSFDTTVHLGLSALDRALLF